MITIIDYGCGNINAFVNVFKRLNIPSKIVRSASDLENCEKIILPGVGAFDHVMSQFNSSGMREQVEKKVLTENIPVLGICAGMQILANGSEEGTEAGLGWIKGHVKKFDVTGIHYKTKLPHMGWNEITHNENPLFKEIEPASRFYFVHSYYYECYSADNSIAQTEYGGTFTSAVNRDNIYGVQFHPEKSHQNGHQLLKNFSIL
jgi:glutamine amidotransferase